LRNQYVEKGIEADIKYFKSTKYNEEKLRKEIQHFQKIMLKNNFFLEK
jgi:hypothetical protein